MIPEAQTEPPVGKATGREASYPTDVYTKKHGSTDVVVKLALGEQGKQSQHVWVGIGTKAFPGLVYGESAWSVV